ncbi:MAG: hypothetical protein RLZZ31_810 [Actinomycetota bacterium]|jgi:hypothetical protein
MSLDDDALRRAAEELIAAGRAFLDGVEEYLDDPEALRRFAAVIETVAQALRDGTRFS